MNGLSLGMTQAFEEKDVPLADLLAYWSKCPEMSFSTNSPDANCRQKVNKAMRETGSTVPRRREVASSHEAELPASPKQSWQCPMRRGPKPWTRPPTATAKQPKI